MLLRAALLLTAFVFSASDFSGARALDEVRKAVSFGPRPAGSAASKRMQAWISEELKERGWEVTEDRFNAQTPGGAVPMTNLVAKRSGLSGRAVVISGHTDTKKFPFRFVGANDGGSSTGLLLELARALREENLRNDVWLVFLDGEEAVREWSDSDSLYGSRQLAAQWAADGSLKHVVALINVDMIGDRDLQILDESNSTPALRQMLRDAAARLGYSRHIAREPAEIEDDHIPFLRQGVPAIDLIDFDYGPGNSWWHTAADTPDKLSASSLRVTGSLVIEMLHLLEPH